MHDSRLNDKTKPDLMSGFLFLVKLPVSDFSEHIRIKLISLKRLHLIFRLLTLYCPYHERPARVFFILALILILSAYR